MRRVKVVLPEPLRPTTPKIEPAEIVSEVSSKGWRCALRIAKRDVLEFDLAHNSRTEAAGLRAALGWPVHDLAEHAD